MGYLRLKKSDTSKHAAERNDEPTRSRPARASGSRSAERSDARRTPWGVAGSRQQPMHARDDYDAPRGRRQRRYEDEQVPVTTRRSRRYDIEEAPRPVDLSRSVHDMTPEEIRAYQIEMARMALRRRHDD